MTCMPVESDMYITSGFGPRQGGFHYGTDFGAAGGSGGRAVYAARAGTVIMCGAASGFGQWVVVDHPEGGTTVYGHVIPEVTTGQSVAEGQRIARINSDQATNGGVAPHLHFEWHRYVWVPPGTDRLDPMSMLAGAKHPNQSRKEQTMTLFGVDVSEHQDGMSLKQAAAEGISFAIIRTTDGTYKDRCYRSHLDDAEGAGLITAAYHYLRAPSEGTSIAQQVQASREVMGDKPRPMWLDCETDAGLSVEDIREAKRLFEAAGVPVVGVYTYVPWWERRVHGGEPDSHEFGALWVAAYGANRTGLPADLYATSRQSQWEYPLGNQKPILWQFGSNAQVAGHLVDVNAFQGSLDDLRTLLNPNKEESSIMQRILDMVNDIFIQLRGPNAAGWEQLGKNREGQNLTLVDAVAALRIQVAQLDATQQEIHQLLKGALK